MKKILMKKILKKIFFYIYKNGKLILSKNRKSLRRSTQKMSKSFSEKEKKHQYHCNRNKNLYEEEKQKKVEYMRNYYVAHKK